MVVVRSRKKGCVYANEVITIYRFAFVRYRALEIVRCFRMGGGAQDRSKFSIGRGQLPCTNNEKSTSVCVCVRLKGAVTWAGNEGSPGIRTNRR